MTVGERGHIHEDHAAWPGDGVEVLFRHAAHAEISASRKKSKKVFWVVAEELPSGTPGALYERVNQTVEESKFSGKCGSF